MNDMRRREARDAEVFDVIKQCGGLSPEWLKGNRTRPQALRRLLAENVIVEASWTTPEFWRFDVVPPEPPTLWERFKTKVRGGISW